MSLTLLSPDFANNTMIPMRYTCEDEGVSPALFWQAAPANTQSFALLVDDPDAPGGLWVHWVLFNIPSDVKKLSVGTQTPTGALTGKNSWVRSGYTAPCPPRGTHRYFFRLYALDAQLAVDETANEQEVMRAMEHHILGQSELVGLYAKK